MKTLFSVMCHEEGQFTHHIIASSQRELNEKLIGLYNISKDSFEELVITSHANITYTVDKDTTQPIVTLCLDTTEI